MGEEPDNANRNGSELVQYNHTGYSNGAREGVPSFRSDGERAWSVRRCAPPPPPPTRCPTCARRFGAEGNVPALPPTDFCPCFAANRFRWARGFLPLTIGGPAVQSGPAKWPSHANGEMHGRYASRRLELV